MGRTPTRMIFCILSALLSSSFAASQSRADNLEDSVCNRLAVEYLNLLYTERDLINLETESFYSASFDSCILGIRAIVTPFSEVIDLTKNIYRDCLGQSCILMSCERDGINSVILRRADEYDGKLFGRKSADFLDDGFGGIPRTIAPPPSPVSKKQCMEVYKLWMENLKK